MNPFDILGSLMNGRMRPSARRLERTFCNQGLGGPGRMFGDGPGGMPGGAPGGGLGAIFDMLGKMAKSMFGRGASGTGGSDGFSPFDMLSLAVPRRHDIVGQPSANS